MKNWQELITLELVLKILIGLQILAGVFLIVFTNIGLGLALFGLAALIHIGSNIQEQLSGMRELLTYSLFKQNDLEEASVSHESRSRTKPEMPRATHAAPAAHGDELRSST